MENGFSGCWCAWFISEGFGRSKQECIIRSLVIRKREMFIEGCVMGCQLA